MQDSFYINDSNYKKNVQGKRLEWLDGARGFAIALVIFAHVPIPFKLASYIYSFHVPLFFIVSGFLLYRSGLNKMPMEFVKGKFLQLVVPYFFFSVISYVFWLIMREAGRIPDALAVSILAPINGAIMEIRGGPFLTQHNGGLWFICALFVAEVVFYFLYRHLIKGDRTILIISMVVSLVLATLYATFINIPLPWSIDTVPIAVIFLGIGFFIGNYYSSWERLKKQKYTIPLVLTGSATLNIVFWLLNTTPLGRVDMFLGYYGSLPLYILASFFGSLVVLILFESIFKKFRFLIYLGRNSLTIYALHQWVVFGIIGVIFSLLMGRDFPFLQDSSWHKLGNGIIYLALTIALLVPIIWVLNRYLSSFIGRGGRYALRGWLRRRLEKEPIGLD